MSANYPRSDDVVKSEVGQAVDSIVDYCLSTQDQRDCDGFVRVTIWNLVMCITVAHSIAVTVRERDNHEDSTQDVAYRRACRARGNRNERSSGLLP